jgi:hypothetical protein
MHKYGIYLSVSSDRVTFDPTLVQVATRDTPARDRVTVKETGEIHMRNRKKLVMSKRILPRSTPMVPGVEDTGGDSSLVMVNTSLTLTPRVAERTKAKVMVSRTKAIGDRTVLDAVRSPRHGQGEIVQDVIKTVMGITR